MAVTNEGPCSTPEGITAEITEAGEVGLALDGLCSTPEGITAEITPPCSTPAG